MTSERKAEANAANAALSTGPEDAVGEGELVAQRIEAWEYGASTTYDR